jgi:hypothetical protein
MQNKTASSSNTLTTDNNLVGGISSLNFSRRKLVRERTLLSSINDMKVTRVIEVGPHMDPVKANDKNANSEATIFPRGNKRTFASADYQFEPPAKLFRASADLGPQRSIGMSSSLSNFPSLSIDRDETGDAKATGDNGPRWSNPDPYTTLPSPDESQRKKKDTVKFICKVRSNTGSDSAAKTEATTDYFNSFDFGDDDQNNTFKENERLAPGIEGVPINNDDELVMCIGAFCQPFALGLEPPKDYSPKTRSNRL